MVDWRILCARGSYQTRISTHAREKVSTCEGKRDPQDSSAPSHLLAQKGTHKHDTTKQNAMSPAQTRTRWDTTGHDVTSPYTTSHGRIPRDTRRTQQRKMGDDDSSRHGTETTPCENERGQMEDARGNIWTVLRLVRVCQSESHVFCTPRDAPGSEQPTDRQRRPFRRPLGRQNEWSTWPQPVQQAESLVASCT